MIRGILAAVALLLASGLAGAQTFPAKPVTLIVPWAAPPIL